MKNAAILLALGLVIARSSMEVFYLVSTYYF